MKIRISIVVILSTTLVVNCLPPPHPAVVAVRQAEGRLPPHLKSPALRNPHLLETLELTSLLHHGEQPVFDRDADHVPREEIYKILTHAGFISRQRLVHHLSSKHFNNVKAYPQSHDLPFTYNSDILQYL